MTGLTERIARFLADDQDRIPNAAFATVRVGFTDSIATMIAGRDEPVSRLVREVAGSDQGTESRLCFTSRRASGPAAALVNGTAAHALDFDDVALAAHPSAVLVPAILAEAETLGASGDAMMRAYVMGYEVWAELSRRDLDRHHEKGWHPTGIFGVVAAAAACAVLRGLDSHHARAALGVAASMAGGIAGNFGTMTKPFHAGRAAQGGLLAARLAARGMTAAPDALEHPLGFLRAVSPAGRVDLEAPAQLGETWRILEHGLSVKKYPLCYSTHRSLDAAIALVQEHDLGPDQVAAVEVVMGDAQAAILRNHRPRAAMDAKFSEEFAMAAAVVARRAGLRELTDDFVTRPEIQALMARVTVAVTAERDPEDPVFSPTESVTIRLSDGRTLESGPVRYPTGHAKRPMSSDDIWIKFADCLSGCCAPEVARTLFARLQALEDLASPAELPIVEPAGASRGDPFGRT